MKGERPISGVSDDRPARSARGRPSRSRTGGGRRGANPTVERSDSVNTEMLVERFFEALISGDRATARALADEAAARQVPAGTMLSEVYWPTYEMIERLFRSDQMTTLSHHLATRLLRVLCDQVSLRLTQAPRQNRRVFAVCGPTDADELAGQIAIDLLEHEGFTVSYAGGGIASDEILAHVQEHKPDTLLLFASAPSDLPSIRGLIDTIHEIGAVRTLQIVVGGGVFNRAEGLAEEIGADLWATSPIDLVRELTQNPDRRARTNQHTVGRKRRVRAEAA